MLAGLGMEARSSPPRLSNSGRGRQLETDALNGCSGLLLVGHTHLSNDDTPLLEAGNIEAHHVVLGAHPEWIGIVALAAERFLPRAIPTSL